MATQSAVDGSADFKWRRRARLGRKLSQPQTEHADFRLTYLLALILGIVLVAGFTWSIVERERRNTLGYWNANLTGAARLAWVRVSDWLNERRSNGEVIATSAVVRAVLTKPLGSDAKEDVEVRERATVEHPRYESPSVQQVLGYDPSDLIGGGVFDLIDPDDLARAQQALQSAVDRGMAAIELRARHKDGSCRVLECTLTDLRQEPSVGAQRMDQLIQDLLQLSRVARGEMHRQPVDLSNVAQRVTADLRQSQPDRDVEVVIADGVMAAGDPHLLQVVLENLLGNAWKYTSKQATARIEFGVQHAALEVGEGEHGSPRLSELRAPQPIYFVRDDGAGFDMQYAGKLFAAFQRLHSATEFEGTGIGLASVQRIIRRHGGRIWAEAAVGRGATFYFTLG